METNAELTFYNMGGSGMSIGQLVSLSQPAKLKLKDQANTFRVGHADKVPQRILETKAELASKDFTKIKELLTQLGARTVTHMDACAASLDIPGMVAQTTKLNTTLDVNSLDPAIQTIVHAMAVKEVAQSGEEATNEDYTDAFVDATEKVMRSHCQYIPLLSPMLNQYQDHDTGIWGCRINPYNALYRVTSAWNTPFAFFLTNLVGPYAEALVPGDGEALVNATVAAINHFNKKYMLTNGCYEGQLARILNTTTVAHKVLTSFPLHERKRYYEAFATHDETVLQAATRVCYGVAVSQDVLLQGPNGYNPDDPQWLIIGESELSKSFDGHGTPLPGKGLGCTHYLHVEQASSAGPGYPTDTKRKHVLIGDMQFANRVMRQVLKLSQMGSKKAGRKEASNAIKAFNGAMQLNNYAFIKPKYEVMERSKLRTKVRNIFVYSSYMQVHVGIVANWVKALCKTRLTFIWESERFHKAYPAMAVGDRAPISLMGFNPFGGGLMRMFVNLSKIKNLHLLPFYSDNIYYCRCRCDSSNTRVIMDWLSYDVEKMESTSTAYEGGLLMNAVCASAGIADKYLASYLKMCGGTIPHTTTGILQNYAIPIPGQGSGSQMTFHTNHYRMACFACQEGTGVALESGINGNIGENVFARGKPFESAAGPFNLELTLNKPYTEQFMRDPFTVPLQVSDLQFEGNKVYCDLAHEPDSSRTAIVALDLLGYDAAVYRKLGTEECVMVPVLNYGRLMRAVLFRKSKPPQANSDDSPQFNFVYNATLFMTMVTLQMVGGYAYPTIELCIRGSCRSIFAQLKHSAQTLLAARGEDINEDKTSVLLTGLVVDELNKQFDESSTFVSPMMMTGMVTMVENVIRHAMGFVPTNEAFWEKYFDRISTIEAVAQVDMVVKRPRESDEVATVEPMGQDDSKKRHKTDNTKGNLHTKMKTTFGSIDF